MNIRIENIYYILCYAWDKLKERDVVRVNASSQLTILNLFARVLITGTHMLLRRGIDRDYLRCAEDTSSLKGKINFQESIKRNLFVYARAHCEYDELDHNVVHNQILKATMRQLIALKDLDKEYRSKLVSLVRRFHDISDIDLMASHFNQVRLHRNNFFYDFLLKICRLILDNLRIDEQTGESKFMDFFQDERQMAYVFEKFLRRFYAIEQKQFKVKSEYISWDAEAMDEVSMDLLPGMKTDISLESGTRKIIIDAKFYKQALVENFGKEILRSGHLYQLSAYLQNIEAKGGVNRDCEGMLIYPTVEQSIDLNYNLKGHKVRVRTINLDQEWEKIDRDLRSFIA
ncbi:MAG: 5-methylcytosine-specific restriction endonuclease system specificity protein McrC [bacterium]|nr:5-methylcytosine-specific restriction endonuclease system specificity protein McrC [bacterium]